VNGSSIDGAAGRPTPTEAPRLSCAAVTVQFGGVVAVHQVDLTVPAGEIVGLVGPNGAGKSTLFGVLSGLLRPTAGRVFLEGEDVTRTRPQYRAQRGLARTFQHPELFPGLTVRDHLVLAHRVKSAPRRVWSDLVTMGGFRPLDRKESEGVDELVEMLELTDIAARPALGLPLGLARLVEVARALATSPTVLLLDEPSSGLDSADTSRFEATLRRVAAESGISVLLVEHDVDLVLRLCGTVNVLDFGLLIASGTPEAIRGDQAVRSAYLGEQPVGGSSDKAGVGDLGDAGAAAAAAVSEKAKPESRLNALAADRRPVLSVRDLCVRYGEANALSGVSFDLHAGEALAVLGPNGAGKSSLARAISGLVAPAAGTIELDGTDVSGLPAHRLRRRQVLHLPEGRGVFRALSVDDNLKMAAVVLQGRRARREAVELALQVFPRLAERRRQPAALLSGGEQQMLSLARAVATSPLLLVVDEMSLGLAPIVVDVMFDGLARARDAGVTVLMIEQYVHRALAFADRCIVLQRGSVVWDGQVGVGEDEMLRHYMGNGMVAAT